MARNIDYSEWNDLISNLENLEKEWQIFINSCAKEIAARLLRKVVNKTPKGQYPRSTGKVGGTLIRGWTSKTHNEAEAGTGKGANATKYTDSLTVKKSGTNYIIEIINPVEYASYVEFGHRRRGGKGWVAGRFMLTISESEIRRDAPKILEQKIKRKLESALR